MKKRRCALGMLLVLALFAAQVEAKIQNPTEACDKTVADLLSGDTSGKRVLQFPELLPAGFAVETWHKAALVTPSEGYVVFIDDMAYASFSHPCRYVFVDRESGALTVTEAMTPPKDAASWIERETKAHSDLMAATNRRAPSRAHRAAPRKSARGGELYAVLMNGGYDQWNNHVRYWNDLSNIYKTLVDVYGYKDENIIVLCSDGLNPSPDQSNGQNSNPDLDGDGDADIMYSTTLANVQMVFNQLKTTLTADDQLFFFATDHGSGVSGWSTDINLWNYEVLHDWQWQDMIDALPACDMVVTLEPCFSGGFLDNTTHKPPRVFSSACNHLEYSWAMPPDYVYDTYVFHWTAAVKGEDAYGKPVNADQNSDGLIQMHEAYNYALAHDMDDEHPQYSSNPTELGDEMTLFGAGKVWYVPSDFSTIQAAINASEDKDTIRVAAGTYAENLLVQKAITIESTDGPEVTVIDGSGDAHAVQLDGAAADGAVVRGFMVRGGQTSGFFVHDSSPFLQGNVILDNGSLGLMGGGVYLEGGSPIVANSFISGNSGTAGGGIGFLGGDPVVINCTIVDNLSVMGGGGISGPSATLENCILWDNAPQQASGGAITINHSDVMNGYAGTGNIDRDPLFADSAGRLKTTSPCINLGEMGAVDPEWSDLYGNARVLIGCPDMGACECADAVLTADAYTLHPRVPGQIAMQIDFGPSFAGRKYAVLGSATGCVPGITVQGTIIPLNWDLYTDLVILNLNTSLFTDFMGTLDASGKALPSIHFSGGGDTGWVGLTLNHAALTMGPFDAASNPVPVTFK